MSVWPDQTRPSFLSTAAALVQINCSAVSAMAHIDGGRPLAGGPTLFVVSSCSWKFGTYVCVEPWTEVVESIK